MVKYFHESILKKLKLEKDDFKNNLESKINLINLESKNEVSKYKSDRDSKEIVLKRIIKERDEYKTLYTSLKNDYNYQVAKLDDDNKKRLRIVR